MPADYPEDCLYHRDALWLRPVENGEAMVGVTHFAQAQLGQVMYVDLPRVGSAIRGGTALGTIESRKAVSDLVAPASGKVLEINPALRATPGLVNQAPYAEGWLLRIALSAQETETTGLLDATAYRRLVGAED